jgi:phosphomannomutase
MIFKNIETTREEVLQSLKDVGLIFEEETEDIDGVRVVFDDGSWIILPRNFNLFESVDWLEGR